MATTGKQLYLLFKPFVWEAANQKQGGLKGVELKEGLDPPRPSTFIWHFLYCSHRLTHWRKGWEVIEYLGVEELGMFHLWWASNWWTHFNSTDVPINSIYSGELIATWLLLNTESHETRDDLEYDHNKPKGKRGWVYKAVKCSHQ